MLSFQGLYEIGGGGCGDECSLWSDPQLQKITITVETRTDKLSLSSVTHVDVCLVEEVLGKMFPLTLDHCQKSCRSDLQRHHL